MYPKDNSEFAVHCYLLGGFNRYNIFQVLVCRVKHQNGRNNASICTIHSNLIFNYLSNVLPSAKFQWETVNQSKRHTCNSENSNAFFFFLVVLHWRVKGKGGLYSRWKHVHVHACLSVYVWQERSSPTFCNYFSQQIPINPNTQTCKRLCSWACLVTTSVETS